MADEKRTYRMKRRAELLDETRRRITESAVELHGTLGPARTSMSAVAERAGVRRSTLYRHFPDEEALFAACSSHWSAANPLPDPSRWRAIDDPDERLRAALPELYAYYRETHAMWEHILRDQATMPVVHRTLGAYRDWLSEAGRALVAGRGRAGRRTRAAIGHALSFSTWRSLALEQRLDDHQAAKLMRGLVEG